LGVHKKISIQSGGVRERFKRTVLKTVMPAMASKVRILPPPLCIDVLNLPSLFLIFASAGGRGESLFTDVFSQPIIQIASLMVERTLSAWRNYMRANKLAQSVARLYRAGYEHSSMIKKLEESVDEVAKYLRNVLQNESVTFPRHYHFQSWPSGDYILEKLDDLEVALLFQLKNDGKSREDLLRFAADVADGWLDEVSAWLEQQTALLKKTDRIIEGHQVRTRSRVENSGYDPSMSLDEQK
jgi:hypothetical protein